MNTERIKSIEIANTKLPKIIEVGPSQDFVYIMREDTDYTMTPMASKFSQDYGFDSQTIFNESYRNFTDGLANTFYQTLSDKGNVEVHLFQSGKLDDSVRMLAANLPIISMDPLMRDGAITLPVSRGYFLGGITDFGPIARPGYKDIDTELSKIATQLTNQTVCLAEDDIYTGGTVVGMTKKLQAHHIKVDHVITGIQIGVAKEITDRGITIDPVVKYLDETGKACPEKIDLGDPRDFLIGASGLVVKLPSGNYGRVPYILPFVSSSERCSIASDKDIDFAKNVMALNKQFFHNIQEATGQKALLRHMDPHFILAMQELYDINEDIPMEEIVDWANTNMTFLWQQMKTMGEQMQERSRKYSYGKI